MTIQELEKIMQEHGAVIRAIPLKIREILEASYEKAYPDGQVMYLDEYKREMLVREYVPKHAGEFCIEAVKSATTTVIFGPQFFDSIEDAVSALINGDVKSPNYMEKKKDGTRNKV